MNFKLLIPFLCTFLFGCGVKSPPLTPNANTPSYVEKFLKKPKAEEEKTKKKSSK